MSETIPRIPTIEARKVLEQRAGPVYEAIVAQMLKLNPGLARDEIERGLHELLGPWRVADIYVEPRTIPTIPAVVRIPPDGKRFELLEFNPINCLHLFATYSELRRRAIEVFGTPEEMLAQRERYIMMDIDPDIRDAEIATIVRNKMHKELDGVRRLAADIERLRTKKRGFLRSIAPTNLLKLWRLSVLDQQIRTYEKVYHAIGAKVGLHESANELAILALLLGTVLNAGDDEKPVLLVLALALKDKHHAYGFLNALYSAGIRDNLKTSIMLDQASFLKQGGLPLCTASAVATRATVLLEASWSRWKNNIALQLADYVTIICPPLASGWFILEQLSRRGWRLEGDDRDHVKEGLAYYESAISAGGLDDSFSKLLIEGSRMLRELHK